MDRTVWASPAAPKSWKWLLALFSTVKPACLKYRAYDGGVRKAKQLELGLLPHLPAVAVVSVPSRLPKTIWAPFLSSGRTARKYVPGSGGRSGVLPSIMSPTAGGGLRGGGWGAWPRGGGVGGMGGLCPWGEARAGGGGGAGPRRTRHISSVTQAANRLRLSRHSAATMARSADRSAARTPTR